jgi:2-oxoglutarate ferredoxin oxidoreductase subunit beta
MNAHLSAKPLNKSTPPLKPADFASDQQVRWCPGCGDYAILKAVQRTLAELRLARKDIVFVSGIGCSSRLPYYLSTYGFHTIHGRAPAVATGIKLANRELDVWVITGDGDGLSIGGNQLLHALRRNVDLQILLFNNEIYGLTKGQYSPTSRRGTTSPSTPYGSIDNPVSATRFAMGAGARFIARAIDTDQKQLPSLLQRAHAHQGTSFVEILQNCIVYNDAVFADFADKTAAAEHTIVLEHGKPLQFGTDQNKGLRLKSGKLALEVVDLDHPDVSENDLLIHDETNPIQANLLAAMDPPQFPMALGVLYCDPAPSLETLFHQQLAEARAKTPTASELNAFLRKGNTWTIGS